MAKDTTSTLKYKADIAELKSGFQQAKTAIAGAKAEFDKSTEGLNNWRRSSEGVEAKLKQLKTTLVEQNKQLNNYRDQLVRTEEQFGENSIQAEQLREKIEKQKSTITKTNGEIKKYERSLKDVVEAEELAERESISVNEAFDKLRKSSDKLEESIDETSDGFTVMKGALASLIADGIKSFIGGIAGAVDETREFRNELAMLEATAETTGGSFKNAEKNLQRIATITDDTGAGVEAVNNLMSAGFKGDALDDITEQLLGASIKWKDTLKMEGIADGLQETLATNNAIGPFAELLERGGQSLDTFNAGLAKCKTEAEKQNFVLETLSKMGLTDTLDAYEENSEWMLKNANASYELQENMSRWATKVEPIVASVKQGVADLFGEFLNLSDGVNFEGIATKIQSGFGAVKQVLSGDMSVGDLISTGAKWIEDIGQGLVQGVPNLVSKGLEMIGGFVENIRANAPKLVQSGLELIHNLVRGLMNSLPELISKVPIIVSNIAGIINDNMPTILAKGVQIIWTIIKGLLKAIPTLVLNVPKIIKAIVDVFIAFNWMNLGKTIITKFKDGIASMAPKVKEAGKNIYNKVIDFLIDLPGKLFTIAKNALTRFVGIFRGASGVSGAMSNLSNAVINGLKALPGKIKSIGGDIVEGLWNGIGNKVGWITSKLSGFKDSVMNALKSFFKIKSPSRLMRDEIGAMLAEGIGVGFTGQIHDTVKTMKSSLGGVVSGLQKGMIPIGVNGSGGVSAGTTYNFYQTNNSPKALSRLEIYRQTKNQMLLLKGVNA